MFAPQVHLMLNHVPVLGAVFATAALAAGLRLRNDTLTRFALISLVVAAVAAIPVYFSGGLSESAVEKMAGVRESSIERHEDTARAVTLGLVALGLISFVALLRFRHRRFSRVVTSTILVGALALSGGLAWTAHLGGQIRHPEIQGGSSSASIAATPEAAPGSEQDE